MDLGLSDVSLTTNAQLLPRYAQAIIDSGMRRINVSLDTLDRERFEISPAPAISTPCCTG